MSVNSVSNNRPSVSRGLQNTQNAQQTNKAAETQDAKSTQETKETPEVADAQAQETVRATQEVQDATRVQALGEEQAVKESTFRAPPSTGVSASRGLQANAKVDDANKLTGTGLMKRGAEGPEVKNLQERLNAHGANLTTDGDFGRKTETAVKNFQRNAGLSPDGVVGPKTREALNADPAAKAAEASNVDRTKTLRSGAEGPEVKDLQERLNQQGYNLTADGDFGRKTGRAVMDFQARNGLQADGVYGPATQRALAAAEARQANGTDANAGTDGTNANTGTGGTDATAGTDNTAGADGTTKLQRGADGPEVKQLQERLNTYGYGLATDGDFGPGTERAVRDFQDRAGLMADGVAGPTTFRAMDEVDAGTRQLREPPIATNNKEPTPGAPAHKEVTVGDNTFDVHNRTRYETGRRSVPGDRKISFDANSGGRDGEILRPLVVIPNDATPAERAAAQQAADRVAKWFDDNLPGDRKSTGIVRTTAENGRGVGGFFHAEFHSVHDHDAVNLIKNNPQEYARMLGETMGSIPGANFIVPHGREGRWGKDPGATSFDGKTHEVGLARHVIEQGFFKLD